MYGYSHVQDLLEILDAREEIMDIASKERDRIRKQNEERDTSSKRR